MEKLLPLLGPVILAFFVASKMAPHYDQTTARNIAKIFETVAGVLLPLLILSIVRNIEVSNDLWQISAIGFVIPIGYYLAIPYLSKLVSGPSLNAAQHRPSRLLFSSFGGGNRGNLMLLVLATAGLVTPEVTPLYVALDLGNLLCVVTLGFILATPYSGLPNLRLSEVAQKILASPGFYAAIMVASHLPGLREKHLWTLITSFDPTIRAIGTFITPFFSFFVFLAIFIRSENLTDVIRRSPPVVRLFVVAHVLPAVAVLWLTYYLPSAFLTAIAVLVLMPPSSYLWSRITGKHPDPDAHEDAYLIPNLFYFIALGVAIVFTLRRL
jgi:hypothetical protein